MRKGGLFFTAGQFARLHRLNKRTLHYYDDIGLFSPAQKGDNGYRYYAYQQSAQLENILALRELGMTIEEIRDYLKHPAPESFLRISAEKTREIDAQIMRLKKLKGLLREKREALALCAEVHDGKIEIVERRQKALYLTPLQSMEAFTETDRMMEHLQVAWDCTDYKANCGSYISLGKVRQGQFDDYDGLFTVVDRSKKGRAFLTRPEGSYLCGYCVGDWSKIPALYQKMLVFAERKDLRLTGNCYELGLNEFAISHMSEYVTQIEIQITRANIPPKQVKKCVLAYETHFTI